MKRTDVKFLSSPKHTFQEKFIDLTEPQQTTLKVMRHFPQKFRQNRHPHKKLMNMRSLSNDNIRVDLMANW